MTVNNRKTDGRVYDPPCGEGSYILTPTEPPQPRIHGPSVFGVRPQAPFLYQIPATGEAPLRYAAAGLPDGLTLDSVRGIISGTVTDPAPGKYSVLLRAENALGSAEKALSIEVGERICLTPPLGWNSWNCWKDGVTQQHVLDSAHAMVDKGLRSYGWSYVNIDDGWQGRRGGTFNAIQPDPRTFPDMGKMCAEIHALGLKAGIYSTPWITTYAGRIGGSSDHPEGEWIPAVHAPADYRGSRCSYRVGRFQFDENDAAQWAEWGMDYLKYDWNPNDPESTRRMADVLRRCGRDMVFSISNSAPVQYAALYAETAHCIRTTGDLKDRWEQSGGHLNISDVWKLHRHWLEHGVAARPGHFPDADMLVVGNVSTRGDGVRDPAPSRLTPDEQYSHVSLWVLWASALLIGCPVEQMDAFTLNLLTNSEVLAVHQDALAVSGTSYDLPGGAEVVVKELAGGAKAVGLFNLCDEERIVQLDGRRIGLRSRFRLRDLWRQKEIGRFDGLFSAKVRPHGVVFLRAE